jgi:hypothetical protein
VKLELKQLENNILNLKMNIVCMSFVEIAYFNG